MAESPSGPLFSCVVEFMRREDLESRDDGRTWFVCAQEMDICLAAYVVTRSWAEAFEVLERSGHVKTFRSLGRVSGEVFQAVRLGDAFVIKEWKYKYVPS